MRQFGRTLMHAHGFWIGLWLALTVLVVLFVPSQDGMTLHRALVLLVSNGGDAESDGNVKAVVAVNKHHRE